MDLKKQSSFSYFMAVFDVAIIGAGPAGGNTAINTAKNGLKTLVFEEHKTIGEPVHCGECLSGLALERQKLVLPEKVISKKVKGVRIIFPNNKSHLVTEPGVVLEKHLFEQWLAKKAVQEGAEILLDHKVLDLKKEGTKWNLKTNHGEIEAKIVIDASGVQSVVSQKTGLNSRFESVVGIQHEIEGIPNDGYLDFHLWPDLAPEGYCWAIPKSNNRANVGLVTNQKNKAKEFCNEFIERKGWQEKTVVKTFGGLIPASGPVKKTFSDGLLLIGDAAGFTSPMFEGGTQLGLQSGRFAAQAAVKAIKENNWQQQNLAEYETMWKKEFPSYNALVKGKKAIYSFSVEELNRISEMLPKELRNLSLREKLKIGGNILRKNPHLLKKGILNAFRAFEFSGAEYYGW